MTNETKNHIEKDPVYKDPKKGLQRTENVQSWQERFYDIYQNVDGDRFTRKEDRLIQFIQTEIQRAVEKEREEMRKKITDLPGWRKGGFNGLKFEIEELLK